MARGRLGIPWRAAARRGMVRAEGLEPPRLSSLEPKSSASTSSAMSAYSGRPYIKCPGGRLGDLSNRAFSTENRFTLFRKMPGDPAVHPAIPAGFRGAQALPPESATPSSLTSVGGFSGGAEPCRRGRLRSPALKYFPALDLTRIHPAQYAISQCASRLPSNSFSSCSC